MELTKEQIQEKYELILTLYYEGELNLEEYTTQLEKLLNDITR